MADIKLPELGEGVTEGELIKWLVKPGDTVKADQSVAEIMTDKATVEVPSTVTGIVKELKFKVGDIIKVESILMTLDGAGVAPSATSAKKESPAASAPIPAGPKPAANSSASMNGTNHLASTTVKLPELGEGVTEGELVKWLVKPGDMVKADQSIAEVMTDKATVEVPTPVSGTVKELKFKVGDIVKVESVMITLDGATTAAKTQSVAAAVSQPPAGATAGRALPASAHMSVASAAMDFYPPAADSKVLATPATRRLARELGVDINQMAGSGLAGRVTRDDVLSKQGSVSAKGQTPMPTTSNFPKPAYNSSQGTLEERVPMRGIRKKIAENMQMAKAIIPHFTLMDEADVTELVALRESLKETAEKNGTKITFLPFVMKAMISTIHEFPMFNASIDDQSSEIVYKKYFNIGFAADTPNGLVVPVIKNADQKSILEISKEILDLAKRARDGKLKSEEMKGATITITNIGSVGGTYATPIINHPEVAILGMYKISDKPIIKNGALASIKVMNYTITADHRLIDGAVAANFLKAFLQRIQKPANLMMEMR